MLHLLKKFLFQLLERRGYCISFGEPATFTGILSSFGGGTQNFFFIQIGAYDGRKGDPIYELIRRNHWTGILVEPQPDIFDRLKQNYAGFPGLVFENAAIAEEGTPVTLYKLKDEYAHLFRCDHRQLSSFNPEIIMRHLSQPVDIRSALQPVETPCLSFAALIKKHDVTKIDLLQIDVEGYDFEIIKGIDFEKIAPKVIHFEHAHLRTIERAQCVKFLIAKGYKLVIGAYDVTAFQSKWMYD
jgi:FkbM family methyltransferase